jgi:prephenate dehydrogenase
MIKNNLNSIVIIGVGLIGGSIALGLKKKMKNIKITGLFTKIHKGKIVQDTGMIDDITTKISDLSENTDLIIISTPISDMFGILHNLAKFSKHIPIMDTASTKEQICQEADNLNLNFIGTHPMSGKDKSGFENSDSRLFENKPWILCPTKHTKAKTIEIAMEVIKEMGAKIMKMTPKSHDELICSASHLPMIIANCLVMSTSKNEKWDEIKNITSSGFESMTRLVNQDIRLTNGIISTNKNNLRSSLMKFRSELDLIIKNLNAKQSLIEEYIIKANQIKDIN